MKTEHIDIFNSYRSYFKRIIGATEDDIQDAIYKVLTSNPDFNGHTNRQIINYFITCVRNVVVDRYRKAHTNKSIQYNSLHDNDNDNFILDGLQLNKYIHSLTKSKYDDEVELKFKYVYSKATPRERKYIHLKFFNDMTIKEISSVTGWNESVIKGIMHRLKLKIIENYGKR